jgi:hypothetical protein
MILGARTRGGPARRGSEREKGIPWEREKSLHTLRTRVSCVHYDGYRMQVP